MNDDWMDPIHALNMPETADMTFAMDLLLRAKESVRSTAIALTEAVSPDARAVLRRQLQQSIAMHGEAAALMEKRGWFYPYDVTRQHALDLSGAKTTLQIAAMELFPPDTDRKGVFDRTPDEGSGPDSPLEVMHE